MQTMVTRPYPFADLALARRLERTEGESCAQFAEARARLNPESGAAWIDVAGTCVVFDGGRSPVTQTFGFALFAPASADDLTTIEDFFRERSSPVFHEICPLADPAHAKLLSERGYHPFEFTSVMFRPISPRARLAAESAIRVRPIEEDEQELWAKTTARGWSDSADLGEFILGAGRINANRPDTRLFLAESEGRPIAAAALTLGKGVALLAGACTIPEARHRGAQLALLASRLSCGAEHGCDLAMMGALPGSASQRNAERHGFRIAYTRTKWRQTDASR